MKKIVFIFGICVLSIISGCANMNSKESIKTSDKVDVPKVIEESKLKSGDNAAAVSGQQAILKPQNMLYTISGEHRDKEGFMIKDDFKIVFPAGKITRVFGSTLGNREKELTMSAQELEELITVLEQEASAFCSKGDEEQMQRSLQLMPESERYDTLGEIVLEIVMNSNQRQLLHLKIHEDDVIDGVSSTMAVIEELDEEKNVRFGVNSPEIAEKLRALIDFKVIDRSALSKAVSATCTSLYNGKSIIFSKKQLQRLVKMMQSASEKDAPGETGWDYKYAFAAFEILLDDGTIIHGKFPAHEFNYLVDIETKQFQLAAEDAEYLQRLFKENDIPEFPPYDFISENVKYVDPENYLQSKPLKRDNEYFLGYAGAANYDSIVRLGGQQRDNQKIILKKKRIILPEGMVINTTINHANGQKVLAIPTEDEVQTFLDVLESSPVEYNDLEVWSDELNIVILDAAGKYSILLFSLNDSYYNYEKEKLVNCMVLSENKKNHGRSFSICSDELYNFVSNFVNTPE
jgi:hypothetical protein